MKSKDATKTSHNTRPIKAMTVREVSAHVSVHPSTIYRLPKHDQLPAFHVASASRFNIEAIHQLALAAGEIGRLVGSSFV